MKWSLYTKALHIAVLPHSLNANQMKQEKQHYTPAKVTQLEDGSFWVDKQVLGLDVSVTHTLGMDVSQTAKQLVHVHLRRSQHKKNIRSDKQTEIYDILLWLGFKLVE